MKLFDKMCKYEMDLASIVEDNSVQITIQCWLVLRTSWTCKALVPTRSPLVQKLGVCVMHMVTTWTADSLILTADYCRIKLNNQLTQGYEWRSLSKFIPSLTTRCESTLKNNIYSWLS